MNPDLDTLATRLYVTIDDLLIEHPQWAPERPAVGIAPRLSDAELLTLAVLQALLGFTSEAQFIRHAHAHLRPWFAYLPDRPGYNKRLRRAGELFQHVIAALARACPSFNDDLRLVDSTPVECGRSRETAKRSDLAGWATYGYCASHSRFFWGLRLHLITTPSGLPVAFALAGAKTDERDTALDMIAFNPELHRPGQPSRPTRATGAPASRPRSTIPASPSSVPPSVLNSPAPPEVPPPVPPDHRVGQPDPQGPTRPRTPRRPHQTRRMCPRPTTTPRAHRRYLAQQDHQPPRARPVTHPLRPLTPWNQSSRKQKASLPQGGRR